MIEWLTGTYLGKILSTCVISMVPFIELRGGVPYGIASGLGLGAAIPAALIGNLLPVPLIILYIRKLFSLLRRWSPGFERLVSKLEDKGKTKGRTIRRYGFIGLVILVGIPLPGTGAWTGALAAAMLDIRMKRAIPAIFVGLLLSALIVTLLTLGVIHVI